MPCIEEINTPAFNGLDAVSVLSKAANLASVPVTDAIKLGPDVTIAEAPVDEFSTPALDTIDVFPEPIQKSFPELIENRALAPVQESVPELIQKPVAEPVLKPAPEPVQKSIPETFLKSTHLPLLPPSPALSATTTTTVIQQSTTTTTPKVVPQPFPRPAYEDVTYNSPGAAKLQRILRETDDLIVCPGVYDGLSARVAHEVGFQALYMTGAGTTASKIGQPDLALAQLHDMREHAEMVSCILWTVQKPSCSDSHLSDCRSGAVRRSAHC